MIHSDAILLSSFGKINFLNYGDLDDQLRRILYSLLTGVMNSRVQKFGKVVMELIGGESNETRLIETKSAEFIQIMNFVKYRITC